MVVWEEERVEGSADEILSRVKEAEGTKTARDEAGGFLMRALEAGEMSVSELRSAAAAQGLAWASVRRAQKALEIVVRRQSSGNRGGGNWTWALPSKEPQPTTD